MCVGYGCGGCAYMWLCEHLWVALPSSGGKDEVIVLFF